MIHFQKCSAILFLIGMLAVLNCTYAQKTNQIKGEGLPGWVNEPHKFYSEAKYLVGVGSGDTRNAAEKDAIANIARVFRANVKVDQTVIENYLETQGKSGSELSVSSQLLKQTTIAANEELKNVKVDQAYFSQSEGIYYALAYLDRAETAELYRQDMAANDAKIQEHFANYKSSANKLHRFASLSKAKAVSAINDILDQQYQIITAGQTAPPPTISVNELDKEMRQLLDQIGVTLNPAAGTAEEVGDYLKETIGKFGFKIMSGAADFSFKYGLEINPTQLNQPNMVGFNWKLTIQVNDNVNQFALKSFNIEKRTVGISEGEARAKIMRAVRSELEKNFYKQFLNYINSL